ncbi:MAG: succinate dehydrogenase assembly factor 2 [Kiloniellales bacterium]
MSESLEIRRKRLKFRSGHRGTKELDLLLGRFAEQRLESLEADQLDRFETLLDAPSPQVYAWITGQESPPPEMDHDVLQLIRDFSARP